MPVVIVLLIKVAPKRNRSQSPADLSNRGGLVMTYTEKPREPLFEGHLSHPTIRPKASAISALDDMGSTQLEEVFDFMEAAPKLRPERAGPAKISSAVGYLALMIFAQIASDGWYNFHTHFNIRATFISLESVMPSPLKALGRHTAGQLTKWYLRFGPTPSQ
jgi:hypothetical protein